MSTVHAHVLGEAAVDFIRMSLQIFGILRTHLFDLDTEYTEYEWLMNWSLFRDRLLKFRRQNRRLFVVICENDNLEIILKQALEVSLLGHGYIWLFISEDPAVSRFDFSEWLDTETEFLLLTTSSSTDDRIPPDTENQIYRDTLILINDTISNAPTDRCRHKKCNQLGKRILHYMKTLKNSPSKSASSTKLVTFDTRHRRDDVTLHFIVLTKEAYKKIGIWRQNGGKSMNERLELHSTSLFGKSHLLGSKKNPLRGRKLKIVTLLESPFVMLKKGHEFMSGNDKYEGYLIDLIHRISENVGFKYELYEVEDGNFGSVDKNGTWNGLMADVIKKKAHMALASITITRAREQAVDFTKPFKSVDINVLIRRPRHESSFLQFLEPFTPAVWILFLCALSGAALVQFAIEKFTVDAARQGEPPVSLKDSLWMYYASIVSQDSGKYPQANSSRSMTCTWWFFGLMIISAYTANLVSFLTVSKAKLAIDDVIDLASQTDIKYGSVQNSRTADFFRLSPDPVFREMWKSMKDNMVKGTKAGVAKVKSPKEKYAFIWDSQVNLYSATQNCEMMVVGHPLDEKRYGIPVPIDAEYRDVLTLAILDLQYKGFIMETERKWWAVGECGDPTKVQADTEMRPLTADTLAGLFVMLGGGIILALIISVIEYKKARDIRGNVEVASEKNTKPPVTTEDHELEEKCKLKFHE
ncbi:glutamate receptor 4-like [Tubulanus polymorphus]|uniref:glutamate receptor 4-like n=1 Tax=Tubulanus polymorphus TaxID=672921 RepID=UPI003DA3F7C1